MREDYIGVLGDYQILRRLGVGGTSEVFLARKKSKGTHESLVALKVILPELAGDRTSNRSFEDEVTLASRLQHPHIVSVYDFGQIEGRKYFAMEYVDGFNLAQLLNLSQSRKVEIPLDFAVYIVLQIARSLDYAHGVSLSDQRAVGLIHRDVSPQNILLSQRGIVKLTDFGIAKTGIQSAHTEFGVVKGRFRYMSPEQADGRELTSASDQYSLGVVFAELITGMSLGLGSVSGRDLNAFSHFRPSDYRKEVSTELDEIVAKLLEKNPCDRFKTCGELANALQEHLGPKKLEKLPADFAVFVRETKAQMPSLDLDVLSFFGGQHTGRSSRYVWLLPTLVMLSLVSSFPLLMPFRENISEEKDIPVVDVRPMDRRCPSGMMLVAAGIGLDAFCIDPNESVPSLHLQRAEDYCRKNSMRLCTPVEQEVAGRIQDQLSGGSMNLRCCKELQ